MTPSLTFDVTLTAPAALRLELAAVPEVAPAFENVLLTDGRTMVQGHWIARGPLGLTLTLPAGHSTLFLYIGRYGRLPAGVVRLPASTTALSAPLGRLSDPATGEDTFDAQIWPEGEAPAHLTGLIDSLFVANPHLRHCTRTFAGLPALTHVPGSLFFALGNLESLVETFRDTPLAEIDEQLLYAQLALTDITGCFEGTALTSLPAHPFLMNGCLTTLTRAFARTKISKLEATLFTGLPSGGTYVKTFAAAPLASVSPYLFHRLAPACVDGLFEPARTAPDDPIGLISAVRIPPEVIADIRGAVGVATRAARPVL